MSFLSFFLFLQWGDEGADERNKDAMPWMSQMAPAIPKAFLFRPSAFLFFIYLFFPRPWVFPFYFVTCWVFAYYIPCLSLAWLCRLVFILSRSIQTNLIYRYIGPIIPSSYQSSTTFARLCIHTFNPKRIYIYLRLGFVSIFLSLRFQIEPIRIHVSFLENVAARCLFIPAERNEAEKNVRNVFLIWDVVFIGVMKTCLCLSFLFW